MLVTKMMMVMMTTLMMADVDYDDDVGDDG